MSQNKTPQNPIRGIIILPDLPLCSHTVVVAAALALLKQFLLSLSLSLGLPLVHTDRFSQKPSGNYKSFFPSKSMYLHSFRVKLFQICYSLVNYNPKNCLSLPFKWFIRHFFMKKETNFGQFLPLCSATTGAVLSLILVPE